MVVLLASKLSQLEQHRLAKLGELLGGTMTETFSGSGNVWCRNTSLVGLCVFNVPVKAS